MPQWADRVSLVMLEEEVSPSQNTLSVNDTVKKVGVTIMTPLCGSEPGRILGSYCIVELSLIVTNYVHFQRKR